MHLNLFRAITGLSGVSFIALGLIIWFKDRRSSINGNFAAFIILVGFWSFGFFLTMFPEIPHDMAICFSRLSHFLGGFSALPFYRFVNQFTKRNDLRGHPIHYWLAIGHGLVGLTPLMVNELVPKMVFPYYPQPGLAYPALLATYFITYPAAFLQLWRVYLDRTEGTKLRQQCLLTLIGVFLAWLSVATLFLLIYNVQFVPQLFFFPFIMFATVYAIIRYQFLDIEVIFRKSLVYSGLIAIITAAYLVMVLVTERWFAGFFGYRSLVATMVVAGLIALGFNPLRDRLQGLIDRALFTGTPPELAAQREQLLVEVRKGDQLKAVATLAAGLAHEVKNPLAAIKTFTEHLTTHYDDPAFRAKFQTIVGGEVERINRIVQQLLEFAKPVPPKLAPLQLVPLLEQTLDFLGQDCLARRIEITRDYQSPGPLLGDASQLKQVFLNLFLNSLEAMNGHGGQLTLTTRQDGAELICTVTDTGTGIAPEHLAHLGEPFYTTKPQGTGLGLAVVQGIVKEHGGRLAISSTPGQGTSVSLFLPLLQ